jgi:hypothetical protein
MKILRDHIRQTKNNLFHLNAEALLLHLNLANKKKNDDWDSLNLMIVNQSERIYTLACQKQSNKFMKLYEKQKPPVEQLPTDKLVVNMSSKPLDEPSKSVLRKGLNFAVTPNRFPMEDIICSVEAAITHLPTEAAEEIRQDVSCVLRKSKLPKPNISASEMKALKSLHNDNDIVILPADKGNATVILDTDQYINKMYDLLSDPIYKKIRNPTTKIKNNINSLIKSSSIPLETQKYLINSDPIPPKIYGLPKIHKEGVPLRPIVSAIGSPTHKIARYIARLIQPFVGQTETYVQDSRHFVNIIKNMKLSETDLLVSFDVISLFTRIPISEVFPLMEQILPSDLSNLAIECLKSTYFYFNGNYYEQTEGTPMGSPLSPVVANLYMEKFETYALSTFPLKPKVFLRYVDDTFVIWQHGRDELIRFFNHLNSINNNIQFTMEIESKKKLPFLDVLVTRNSDGTLGHSVYRKPTHTDRYLNANSHHHPAQKMAVLHTLVNRAIAISDRNHYQSEKNHLSHVLAMNGYSPDNIKRAFRSQENKTKNPVTDTEQELNNRKAILPYIQGVSEKIGKILQNHSIKTIYRPVKKIRNYLRPVKDKLQLQTPGVYHIQCSCGQCYIGESKRLISTR